MRSLTEQLNYMYALSRFGIKPGLTRMKKLMSALGNPEKSLRCIHIAGTNGKGSTAALTAQVLREAGYAVGLYTSPHMYRFNERIRINGVEVSDEELGRHIKKIRTASEQHQIPLTFFEFTTVIAFLALAEHAVDVAVIEVGMGGKWDATNLIHSIVSAITNIGHDHLQWLGPTLRSVARNKAGIIKRGSQVIINERDPVLAKYLLRLADQRQAKAALAYDLIKISPLAHSWQGQSFAVSGAWQGRLSMPLLGGHQLENAAVALAILDRLRQAGFSLPLRAVEKGFANVRWEGRLDVVSREPLIVVDGAHNQEGVRALQLFLEPLPKRKVLVLGIKKDKEIEPWIRQILPLFETVIATQAQFQPYPAEALAAALTQHHPRVQQLSSVPKALEAGRSLLGRHDMMLVTGSLYLVADALTYLRGHQSPQDRAPRVLEQAR